MNQLILPFLSLVHASILVGNPPMHFRLSDPRAHAWAVALQLQSCADGTLVRLPLNPYLELATITIAVPSGDWCGVRVEGLQIQSGSSVWALPLMGTSGLGTTLLVDPYTPRLTWLD